MAFLAGHAPFSELSAAGRAAIGRLLEITYAKGGEALVRREADNHHLWVVRKGAVRLELDGQLVDDVGEGEMFGLSAVAGDDRPSLDAVSQGDCLLYRFHRDGVRALFATEPGFASFFLEGLSARLQAITNEAPLPLGGDLRVPVADLLSRPPVTVDVGATVGEAARRMDRERVSSILLVDGVVPAPVGILTDRDLRGRVLAAGRGPDTPVREVMSSPVETIPADLPVSDAILRMVRGGVHHLPVVRDGAVVGVLANSDLLHHHRQGPAALLKKIEKARDPRSLADYADDVAAMVETLDRSRLEATDIGRVVAALNDALVSRLVGWVERDLGPPPCEFAWIVFGSEGRQEQSFLTDQDNALIYADDRPGAAEHFAELARRVVDGLVEVGFPPCAGGFMATNWCDPLAVWRRRFEDWILRPEPEALLKAANFFDFRAVYGGLDLEAIEEPIRGARGAGTQRLFIAHLARASMDMRPPLGFLHRIREAPEGIDLKAGALMPVVGLARVFALEAGDRDGSTVRRIRTAEKAGVVSEEGAEVLVEAFRFAFALRLRHQLAERRAGRPVDNRVRLEELTPGERRHLKEAFLAIHRLQEATADRLGLDRLGG